MASFSFKEGQKVTHRCRFSEQMIGMCHVLWLIVNLWKFEQMTDTGFVLEQKGIFKMLVKFQRVYFVSTLTPLF